MKMRYGIVVGTIVSIAVMASLEGRLSEGKDITSYSIFVKESQGPGDIPLSRDYANYYKLIRERIRQKIITKYIKHYDEGDVCITFILKSDGSLNRLDIEAKNSTANKELQDIATTSVKEASPFPPFPGTLDIPKMDFNLLVSFRKQ